MSQLDTMLQSIRNKKMDDLQPITEGTIKNHVMKGKSARSSYIKLLQFTQRLLKPYGAKYEAGNRFIEKIYQSVGETCSLDALMTQVLQLEEKDVNQWVAEVRMAGGNSAFALDVLLLCNLMQAGEQGLEALQGLFTLMALDSQMTTEAAKASKLIMDKDIKGVLMTDWQLLNEEKIGEYFGKWNPDDKVLLEAAESLFIRDRITQAYPLFQKLANKGNPQAFYFMGEYSRFGWAGLPENEKLGFHYHHLGAEKGELLCRLQLAYEEGTNKEIILSEVIPKIVQLAQAGDLIAEDELGDAFDGNIKSLVNRYGGVYYVDKEAESWRKKAAENGYWRASMLLAAAYEDGSRVSQDVEKAIFWYEKVYELQGDHAGIVAFRIGDIYTEEKDYTQAFEWYKKGAEAGYGNSMFKLGFCYRYGMGTHEDQQEAMKWLKKVYMLQDEENDRGNEGIGFVAREIGGIYYDQDNDEEALKWLQKAYEFHGDYDGNVAETIGMIYDNQENKDKAFKWFYKGAEKGSDWAMFFWGHCYKNGTGTIKDYRKARKWLQKAIDCHGDAEESAWETMDLLDQLEQLENY